MHNELALEALNEAWRELLPPIVVKKYVLVKRTDEIKIRVPLPDDSIWWQMKSSLTTSAYCP